MFWFLRANFVCSTTDVADITFQTMFSADFMRHTTPESLAPVHSHLNCELFFVNRGQCTFRCGDRDCVCGPSDVLLIPAGARHVRSQILPDTLLHSLQFSFSPNRQTASFYPRLLSRFSSPVLLREQKSLLSTLDLLRREFALQQPLYDTTIDALLQVFYTQLLRSLLDVPTPALPQQFPITPPASHTRQISDNAPQVFYKAILDSFFLSFPLYRATLTELSRNLNLSEVQTRRLVKRYYGVSFQERLIRAKLAKSRFLMDTTDLSLKAIAEQSGYGSYHAFFEAFTSHTGQTPSEYRRTCAGK